MAETKTTATTAKAETPAKVVDRDNELVEFYAFKDAGKYKDDLTCCINGRTYRIKRGVTVRIPRFVAQTLYNSRRQDKAAAEYMIRENEAFEKSKNIFMY
jgi:hypothetical protein